MNRSGKSLTRVVVSEVRSCRYAPGKRPVSWEERGGGIEEIVTDRGQLIRLLSNGGQSSPAPGWEILLTAEKDLPEGKLYEWTLYGLKPGVAPYSMDRL